MDIGKDAAAALRGGPAPRTRGPTLRGLVAVCGLLAAASRGLPRFLERLARWTSVDVPDGGDCLFVGGGGHGAVLFRYGQLQAFLRESRSNVTEVFCSSAGCMAAAFALAGLPRSSIGEVYKTVYDRVDARHVTFPRPDAVVDYSSEELVSRIERENLEVLERQLNVLTVTAGGLTARQPRGPAHLAEILRATTWIPYLTSNALYHAGTDGRRHVDGDFVTNFFPPRCRDTLGPPPFWTSSALAWHALIPVRDEETMFGLVEAGSRYQARRMGRARQRTTEDPSGGEVKRDPEIVGSMAQVGLESSSQMKQAL